MYTTVIIHPSTHTTTGRIHFLSAYVFVFHYSIIHLSYDIIYYKPNESQTCLLKDFLIRMSTDPYHHRNSRLVAKQVKFRPTINENHVNYPQGCLASDKKLSTTLFMLLWPIYTHAFSSYFSPPQFACWSSGSFAQLNYLQQVVGGYQLTLSQQFLILHNEIPIIFPILNQLKYFNTCVSGPLCT